MSEKSAVLLDSGFQFSAGRVVEQIRESLNGRQLEAILLSHSHYDHAAGSPVIKEAFPEAVVAAHPHAANIFTKPGARDLMRQLDQGAAQAAGMQGYPDLFDKLTADQSAQDGQSFQFGDIAVQAWETPGHTRCSVSWYFPEDGLLYASETSGIAPAYPQVEPTFIIGYQMTLDAIEKLEKLGANRVLVPHSGVIPEKAPGEFLANSRRAIHTIKDFVWEKHQQGLDSWDIYLEVKKSYYHGKNAEIQPEAAFDLNTQAMVPRLLAELESGNLAE